jgi:hypothetical protein
MPQFAAEFRCQTFKTALVRPRLERRPSRHAAFLQSDVISREGRSSVDPAGRAILERSLEDEGGSYPIIIGRYSDGSHLRL